MLKEITQYDFISEIPPLRFFGNNQFKTLLGGILSLLFLITTLVVFLHFLIIFIDRDKYILINENQKGLYPKTINFNPSTVIGFALSLNNTIVYRPDAFNFTLNYITLNHTTGKTLNEKIDLSVCKENIFSDLVDHYNTLNFSQMLCPSFLKNFEITHTLGYISNSLRISVDACNNKPTCLNPIQLKDLFISSQPNFKIFYKETAAEFIHENPFDSYINHISIPLNINFHKEIEVPFASVEAIIDNAYITTEEEIFRYYVMEEFNFLDFDFYIKNNNNFLNVNFMTSKNNIIIKRSFMKMGEFVSLFVSYILLLYLLISLFSKHINNYFYLKEMVEKMFDSNENLKLDENFYRFTNLLVEKLPAEKEKAESDDCDALSSQGGSVDGSITLGHPKAKSLKSVKKIDLTMEVRNINLNSLINKQNLSDGYIQNKSTNDKELAGSRFLEIKKSLKTKNINIQREIIKPKFFISDEGKLKNLS